MHGHTEKFIPYNKKISQNMLTFKNEMQLSEISVGHCICSYLINLIKCKIDDVQNGGAPTSSS